MNNEKNTSILLPGSRVVGQCVKCEDEHIDLL